MGAGADGEVRPAGSAGRASPDQSDRDEGHDGHVVLVEHRHPAAIAAHLGPALRRALVEDLGLAAEHVTGMNRLQPAQLIDTRRSEPGLFVRLRDSRRPSTWSSRRLPAAGRQAPEMRGRRRLVGEVEGLGSYFEASSITSSRVTSYRPKRAVAPTSMSSKYCMVTSSPSGRAGARAWPHPRHWAMARRRSAARAWGRHRHCRTWPAHARRGERLDRRPRNSAVMSGSSGS